MKYAYVSVVLSCIDKADTQSIIELDKVLGATCRLHEIVITTNLESFVDKLRLHPFEGPVTVLVNTEIRESDPLKIEALSRSVGDFILEWSGKTSELSLELIQEVLSISDTGIELIEIEGKGKCLESSFLRILNIFRRTQMPILANVGIFFSRFALNQLITKSKYEPKLQILVGNLVLTKRGRLLCKLKPGHDYPVGHKVDLLTRGTSIGSTIPFILAGVSALIGASSALYALSLYIIVGTLPQGWTTLMIAIGLGNASILTLLGFIWSKLSVLQFGITNHRSFISECHVLSPRPEK